MQLMWLENAFLLDPQIVGRLKDLTSLDFSHSSKNLAYLLCVSAKFWGRKSLTVSYFLPVIDAGNPHVCWKVLVLVPAGLFRSKRAQEHPK